MTKLSPERLWLELYIMLCRHQEVHAGLAKLSNEDKYDLDDEAHSIILEWMLGRLK